MGEGLKSDFVGTGPLARFVSQVNGLLEAINNGTVVMPSGYDGKTPSFGIEGGNLVLDLGNAQVFSLKNVSWDISGGSGVNKKTVGVYGGQLRIAIEQNPAYISEEWNFFGNWVDKIIDYNASISADGVLIINIDTEGA